MATDLSGMHEDYQSIKVFDFPFHPLVLALANAFFRFERWRKCRHANPELSIEKFNITSGDGRQVPVIAMTPRNLIGQSSPVVIYYHGGAFALGWASMHHLNCQRYALEGGATVLLVGYRLTPANPFPAPFEDCYAALEWVHANAEQKGFDLTKIATMGDSAGGCLTAAVAQKAADEGKPLAATVMIYPALDSDCKTTSAVEFTNTPIWSANSNRRMWELYLKNVPADSNPKYASPAHRQNLTGQPPAYIETAEFDPLRDEALIYATALEAAGVAVERNETKGTIHGFELAADNPIVEDSMQRRCEYLKRVLA
jgi:acetyl esterase